MHAPFLYWLPNCMLFYCQKQSVSCPASRWKKSRDFISACIPCVFNRRYSFYNINQIHAASQKSPCLWWKPGIHTYFPKSVLTCSLISAPLIELGDGQIYRTFLRSLKKKIPISWTYLFPYICIQQHEKHFYMPMCIVNIWGGGCSLLSTQNK